MVAVLNLKPAPATARIDQRVCLHGVSWQDFEALLAMRGDHGAVRVSYLEGELELMAPSIDHESLKKRLARLLEAYAEERGIELEGFGSWTLKAEAKARGAIARSPLSDPRQGSGPCWYSTPPVHYPPS